MPELPEVQTTVDGINRVAKGLLIKDVWTSYKSPFHTGKDNIANPKFFSSFKNNIVGAKIKSAKRRAKNILIHLSNGKTVLIHMKMTGHMMYGKYKKLNKADHQGEWWRPATNDLALNDPFNRFIRFVLVFSNGKHLVLSDMRKFAKVTMLDTENMHESKHLSSIGPEPLEESFDLKKLNERLSLRPNAPIKLTLMNPEIVAGIGNIYSDEILWKTGIHPLEKTKNVPQKSLSIMLKATKEILSKGINFGGDSMSDYRNIDGERGDFQNQHQAYQRKGLKCLKPKCGGEIIKLKIGGRSAHFCNKHQKLVV